MAKQKELPPEVLAFTKLPWSVWPWDRCRAVKEPNASGYHGRCELKKNHHMMGYPSHALERGMDVPMWASDWSDFTVAGVYKGKTK